jgi:hypothetical protein
MTQPIDYRPGVGYFRRALHDSATREDAIGIALVVIRELERTRDWLHKHELPVPKWEVHPTEAQAKGWATLPSEAS